MSHQDKMSDSIVNHQVIKQVVDWLLPCSCVCVWIVGGKFERISVAGWYEWNLMGLSQGGMR
jgi:hypothetical protein